MMIIVYYILVVAIFTVFCLYVVHKWRKLGDRIVTLSDGSTWKMPNPGLNRVTLPYTIKDDKLVDIRTLPIDEFAEHIGATRIGDI